MPYEYIVPADYAEEEIHQVIDECLASRLDFARRRFAAYQDSCLVFERQYGRSTQESLDQFESGAAGDRQGWFDWYAAAEGKKIWGRKCDILSHLV